MTRNAEAGDRAQQGATSDRQDVDTGVEEFDASFDDEDVQDDEPTGEGGEPEGDTPKPDDKAAASDEGGDEFDRQADDEQRGNDEADEADRAAADQDEEEAGGSGEGQAAGEEAGGEQDGGEQLTAEQVLEQLGEKFEKDPNKRTADRIMHQVSTWHGRLSKLRKEAEQAESLREENQSLKNRISELEKGGGAAPSSGSGSESTSSEGEGGAAQQPPASAVSDEHRRLARSEIAADNGGEVPAYVDDDDIEQRARHIAQREAAIERRVRETVSQELDTRMAPIEEERQKRTEEDHFNAIAQKHDDWADVVQSDDFDLWRQDLPPQLAETVNRVYENGTAEDVIWMIDSYKEARGLSSDSASTEHPAPGQGETPSQGETRTQTRTAPRRGPSRPAAGPSRAGMGGGSFDEGFDQPGR